MEGVEEGGKVSLVEGNMGEGWIRGKGLRAEHMESAAVSGEDGVQRIERAVAGDNAAQGLGGGMGGEHGHSVGEPGAAADEQRVGMASDLKEALLISR